MDVHAAQRTSPAVSKALAHMASTMRDRLHPDLLAQRTGRGTVAGSINRTIGFRFEGDGPAETRQIVPDTQLAAELLRTPAGERMEHFLRASLAQARRLGGADPVVGGIRLLPDEEAAVAAAAVDLQLQSPPKTVRQVSEQLRTSSARLTQRSGGWYSPSSWISLGPHTSRALLTFVGGYTPAAHEQRLHSAKGEAEYVPMLTAHELQHAVTPGWGSWLEEAQAMLLVEGGRAPRQNSRATGFTPQRYAGHLGARDTFDAGWKPWVNRFVRDSSPQEAETYRKQQHRTYDESQEALTELLHAAGIDLRTNLGWEQTRDILQDGEPSQIAGRLARAIVEHNDLSAKQAAELAVNINRLGGSLPRTRELLRDAAV